MAFINCPKVRVEARWLSCDRPLSITVATNGLSEVCIKALPMPSSEKAISIVVKLSPKSGISKDRMVTMRESITVFFRPSLFISIPVGTLKIRNQKKTREGKMLATESVNCRSSFT